MVIKAQNVEANRWREWAFDAAVAAGACLALVGALPPSVDPDWSTVSVLLVLACFATQLRLQLPAVQGVVSLSFVFSFAAIAELPAGWAWAVIAVVEAFEYLTAAHARRSAATLVSELLFRVASTAICVRLASLVYHGISDQGGLGWALGLGLAAVAYFVVQSSLRTLREALRERTQPWPLWRARYFWTSPIYLLAPFGVVVTRLLLNASSFWDSLLGIAVIGAAYAYLKNYFPRLHDQHDRAQQMADVRQRALETLAVAIEAKDGSTAGHLRRVKLLATQLGRRLDCDSGELRTLQLAAVLHDVGKVGVPDYILQKPSRLTDREFQEIATHAAIGADIVSGMDFPEPVEDVVLSHHEHWDGSGYPRALAGRDIPRLARILTIVDCFDALVSDRPYRKAMSIDEAVALMTKQRGKIFDPEIFQAFLAQLPAYVGDLTAELERDAAETASPSRRTVDVKQTWVERSADIDFTSRIKALQKLSRRPDHLVAFYDTMSVLGADLHFERTFKEALRLIAESGSAQMAALFVYSKRRNHFLLQGAVGLPSHCVGRLTLAADQGLAGRAAQTRMAVIDNSAPNGDNEPARYFEAVRCSLAAPLVMKGRLVGLLLLGSEQPSAFSSDQTLLISLLTDKLASTLVASQQLRKIHIDANTDAVTSLPNARASFQRLEQELNRAQRQHLTVGVLYMDLDGLKPVNDSYGHIAGDKLLAAAAARLRQSLRSYDFIGRIGGDEFLAILPGISEANLLKTVTHLKTQLSESPVELSEGVMVRPRISIGPALYPQDAPDPDELVYISDQRMYEDKERSRRTPPQTGIAAGAAAGAATP